MNRGFGNRGFGGINRASNINVNNLGRNTFIGNRTGIGGINTVGRGFGNPGLGYSRGYGFGGGFGRGFGNGGWGGGFGNGGFGRGFGNGGFRRSWGGFGGYGLGGFGLGFLLGSGLGGWGLGGWGLGGWGYPLGGFGYGGGWGYPYGGYGYGLASCYPYDWNYGGALYNYGYSTYANPYYSVAGYPAGVGGAVYDYSQPLNMVSAPPAETVTDEAASLFSAAREAFRQGNYAQALDQADQALTKNPNDTSLHEFHALCLFALGRYDESAPALYAVLSVGPGWDWPTLIGLYSNASTYEAQLRALEAYLRTNPQSASARFVLAYQYLTEGFYDEAASALQKVVALKPNDTLSAQLLEQLRGLKQQQEQQQQQQQNPAGAPAPPAQPPPTPEPAPANTAVPEGATIAGNWNAEPNANTRIALSIQPGGAFHWQVTQQGQTREFSGSSNFGGGILTLVPDNSPPIVGRVSWSGPDHMTFRAIGDRADAPGLSFAKSGGQ
jgi:tetratricopeptide (TPR) repeat protein